MQCKLKLNIILKLWINFFKTESKFQKSKSFSKNSNISKINGLKQFAK